MPIPEGQLGHADDFDGDGVGESVPLAGKPGDTVPDGAVLPGGLGGEVVEGDVAVGPGT